MNAHATALALLVQAALIAAAPLVAQAQPAAGTTGIVAIAPGAALASETTRASATVVGIDTTNRVVTLKRQDGRIFNVTAGEEVRNFAQIRVGDTVTAEYTRALTLALKKQSSGVAGTTEREALVRAPLGARPGGAIGRQVTILADVVAIDAGKQLVTLRGAGGELVDLLVQDPEQLNRIKEGDQVEAMYSEALAIAVEAAPKPGSD